MITKTLYRYTREDGGTTVSPNQPSGKMYVGKISTLFRLIADEGMVLTNGDKTISCVDTDTPEKWTEIQAPPLTGNLIE